MKGVLSAVFVLSLLSGCAAHSDNRLWGAAATISPGWQHLGDSFVAAAGSPGTWLPIAGALVFQIDDWDSNVSDWASRKTPVFGSIDTADERSTDLANLNQNIYYLTALLAPSGKTPQQWSMNKLKGLAVGFAASESVSLTTDLLKEETARERPNAANLKSFPSGHASRATTFATLASANLDYLSLSGRATRLSRTGIYGLAAATAWARVEARMHYPSDVLAGAALAHFLSRFFLKAFFEGGPLPTQVELSRNMAFFSVSWPY
ncbi:MAG: phosphatase PAP2 family protein [Desulfuromonadales bacterium]|jgi:hypothetical protein|nr:phosphatase PAP2 family protein [Desulfuromonadales bacterium]